VNDLVSGRSGNLESAHQVRERVQYAGVSIYDDPPDASSELFYTPYELECLLNQELQGRLDLAGLPIRTRSKVAKSLVCEILGFAAPTSFLRTSPRFPHLNADLYVQQSNNLQIWNQDVDASRRYILILMSGERVSEVRVVAGADLAELDRTGTLTTKYQASRIHEGGGSILVSQEDTQHLVNAFRPISRIPPGVSPVALPREGRMLDIATLYLRLHELVGATFSDPGMSQERNRGTVVHRECCELLGLSHYADNGQFPDVLSQALEIKLQLARTIDLGLELPESESPVAAANGLFSVRDVRYAIFYAERAGRSFTITELVLVNGADFFREFRQFGGLTSNSKLQLRLPPTWFD